jgi:hypothetical protein
MNDPRLNSVHLKAGRRQQFRSARESLLHSGGPDTLAADHASREESHPFGTALPRRDDRLPVGVDFALIGKDHIYPLKVGINTVGRMPDNDVVIADPYVSRRHIAVLVHADHVCEVHDIASKNGTFINGSPLAGPTRLHSGDTILLAGRELVFLSRADGSEASWLDEQTQVDEKASN